MKRDIDAAIEAVVAATRERGLVLKAEAGREVAKAAAELMGPATGEAYAADKQLANLRELGPILLDSDDLALMQVLGHGLKCYFKYLRLALCNHFQCVYESRWFEVDHSPVTATLRPDRW